MALPPAYHESLPYIDPEPSPDALSAARTLISAEQSTFSPPPPPAALPNEPSFSPAVLAELARIASSQPSQPLDLSRYEAQELPLPADDYGNDHAAAHALGQSLAHAYVSASYLSSRAQNLNLLDRHGRDAWLLANYHLEADLRGLERDLADTKRDIDLVNVARAARQNEVKAEMQSLDQNWRAAVGRVLEAEIAVEELKAQIRDELRNRGAAHTSVAMKL